MSTTHSNGQAEQQAPPSTAEVNGGRDPRGRFTAGNTTGPRFQPGNRAARGNPAYRRMAAHRSAILNAVSPEEVATLARRLYDLALQGDVLAARLLLSYVVGRPAEPADPDNTDQDMIDRLSRWPTVHETVAAMLDNADPAQVAEWLATRPDEGLEAFISRVCKECRGADGNRRLELARKRRAGEKVELPYPRRDMLAEIQDELDAEDDDEEGDE
jgi:hypothetical protein